MGGPRQAGKAARTGSTYRGARRWATKVRCEHLRAVAVRIEALDEDQVAHCRGACVVCCGCGAVRSAPVFLGRYTDWGPPMAEQRTPCPDGAALAVIAGPSEDVTAMMAACDEHERARAEEWRRRVDR